MGQASVPRDLGSLGLCVVPAPTRMVHLLTPSAFGSPWPLTLSHSRSPLWASTLPILTAPPDIPEKALAPGV